MGCRYFTKGAEATLASMIKGNTRVLKRTCTHAAKTAAKLLDQRLSDEGLVPVCTFASTASTCVLGDALPTFSDGRMGTISMDCAFVEDRLAGLTKAAGNEGIASVAAEPHYFVDVALEAGLALFVDDSHGLGADHLGQGIGPLSINRRQFAIRP